MTVDIRLNQIVCMDVDEMWFFIKSYNDKIFFTKHGLTTKKKFNI